MSLLSQTFSDKSIAWLLITTVVSLLMGTISSWFTYWFVKRRELIESRKLDGERQKEERIRTEILRWANPILGSVKELTSLLYTILKNGGFVAMTPDYKGDSRWSISYDYFMNSLLFLFGQYFAWLRMFQEEFNFELFKTQSEKDNFLEAVHMVRRALAKWPPSYECEGKDTQVFSFQQRFLGELLIVRDCQSRRCMSYPEFMDKMRDPLFAAYFQPLVNLLNDIRKDEGCRWKRLEATLEALNELEKACKGFLDIK